MASEHDSVRLVALDGLRALAVALVVADHSFVVAVGGHGVRLFFVLSGFLITGILLGAREQALVKQESLWRACGAFYARRTVRIFPLAYAALALAWMIGLPAMRNDAAWYLGYGQNVLMATRDSFDGGLPHFWSLAVEEQFYLLWPFVVLWSPRRILIPLLLLLVALAGLVRGWLDWQDRELAAYVLTFSRLDALAGGGLLALLIHAHRSVSLRLVSALGIGLMLTAWIPVVSPVTFEWGCILISAAIILWIRTNPQHPIARWLGSGWLVYLGTISYGIYVWHAMLPAIVNWTERRFDIWLRFPDDPGWFRFAVVTICSIGMAALSWHLMERPLNDLKRFFPYSRRNLRAQPHLADAPESPSIG